MWKSLDKFLGEYGKPAVVVVFVAVLVRLLYFLCYSQTPLADFHRADQSYYRSWAIEIADGDWVGDEGFEQGPLYPYFLGAVYKIFGVHDNVALVLQLICGVVTCWLVYECGRRLFDERTAFLAGIITAIYGPLVFYECMLMKSFLQPLLTMTALYFALRYAGRLQWAWLVGAGAAIGLACQVRENHVLLAIPVILWVFHLTRRVEFSRSKRIAGVTATVGALVVVMLPATIRNAVVAGELIVVTSGGGEVFYLGSGEYATGYYNAPPFISASPYHEHEDFREKARELTGNKDLTRGQSSRFWFWQGLKYAVTHPLHTLSLTVTKTSILANDFEVPDSQYYGVTRDYLRFLYLLPSYGWVIGLGLVGIGLCLKDFGRWQLPILFVAAHAISVLLFYNFGRFRIGLVPILILFAAHALWWMLAALSSLTRSSYADRRRVAIGVTTAFVITLLAFLPPLDYANTSYEIDRELMYGRLSIRDQKLALAERHIRNAMALSTDVKLQLNSRRELAHVLTQRGKLDEALDAYTSLAAAEQAAEQASSTTHVGLGNVYIALENFSAAETHFRKAIDLNPDDVLAYLDLSALLIQLKRIPEAKEQLTRSTEIQTTARTYTLLASLALYSQNSDPKACLKYHKSAIRMEPGNAEAHFYYANDLMAMASLPEYGGASSMVEAAELLETAARLKPGFVMARFKLGEARFQLGQFAQAVEIFEGITQEDPNHFDAFLNLGPSYQLVAQQKAGENDTDGAKVWILKSRSALERAKAIRPNEFRPRYQLAELLRETRVLGRAKEEWQGLLDLPQESNVPPQLRTHAHLRLGNHYRDEKDLPQAIAHLREVWQATQDKSAPGDPSWMMAVNDLAWILATSTDDNVRKGDDALYIASQVNTATGGENPIVLDTLAAAHAESGQLKRLEGDAKQVAAEEKKAAGLADEAAALAQVATKLLKESSVRFDDAVRHLGKAIKNIEDNSADFDPAYVDRLKERLKLYEKQQPYHSDDR